MTDLLFFFVASLGIARTARGNARFCTGSKLSSQEQVAGCGEKAEGIAIYAWQKPQYSAAQR